MAIGTPVQLGTKTGTSGAASTLIITTGANAPAGNLINVFASCGTTSTTITGVTDSAGNTYTPGTAIVSVGSNGRINHFYCANPVLLSSGGTITVTYGSTSGSKYASAISTSGLATTTPLDKEGAGSQSSSALSASVATGTLNQADELILGFVHCDNGGGDTFTEASGFTANSLASINPTGALHSGYQIVSSTSTVTYAPSWNVLRGYEGNVVSFKMASAADTLFAQAVF